MHNNIHGLSGHLGRKKTCEIIAGFLLVQCYGFNVREDVHMQIVKCDVSASIKSKMYKSHATLGKVQICVPSDQISTCFWPFIPYPHGNRYIPLPKKTIILS